MPITHGFVSEKEDTADSTLLQPTHWNADHVGVLYSPDYPPSSPSAYDCEFDAALSGWTTMGSLDTSEANAAGFQSHYHIRKDTSGNRYDGIYKASPSVPFTVTAKLTDYLRYQNYQSIGLVILNSTPNKIMTFGPMMSSGISLSYMIATYGSTRGSFADTTAAYGIPKYIRMIVTSATNVSCQASIDGLVWITIHSAINPSLTDVTYFGIYVWTYNAVPSEGAVDWIRFT